MPTYADIPLLLLALASAGLLAYWSVALLTVRRLRSTLLTPRQALALPELPSWPSVCVVIPAHNESRVIAGLAKSLRQQDYPHLRVVFSLDRCTDDTEAILATELAGDTRFRVHQVSAWPEGWAGKVNAVWSAVRACPEAYGADLLLFADADTLFDPRCVRASVKLMTHRQVGLLSLLSSLTHRAWFERLVQPAATTQLMRTFPPLRVNRDRTTRGMANGQFMLFTREAYFRAGGHPSVREALLEDLALAQRVKRTGHMAEVAFADAMLTCRMYESYDAFCRGWKRIFTESARQSPARLYKAAITTLLETVILPAAGVVCLVWSGLRIATDWPNAPAWLWPVAGLALLGLVCYQLTMILGFRLGRAPLSSALIFPLGSVAVCWLLVAAGLDLQRGVPIRWAGRQYVLKPRKRGQWHPAEFAVVPAQIPSRDAPPPDEPVPAKL